MSATGLYRAIRLDWINPTATTFANTQIWVSLDNDRTNAVLLAAPPGVRGLEDSFTHTDLEPGDVRYYWRRPRHFDGTFDAYDPVSSTGGWEGTASGIAMTDLTLRVVTLADADPVTPNADTTDVGVLASLSQATTFNTPTGTPTDGQQLLLRILSSTSRALTWQSGYRSTSAQPLPSATTGSSLPDYVLLRYHAADSKWDCILSTASSSMFSTRGKHSLWMPAQAFVPSVTTGATRATVEQATNDNTLALLEFPDGATKIYAETTIAFPKKWNLGTLTYKVYWTLNSTSTNSAVFGLQGVAVSDNDALDVAYGTAIEVTDAGLGTSAYKTHVTAESSAVTVGGTPADEDLVMLRVYRDPANGSDTLAVSVYLIGVKLYFTTDADTDV